MKAITQARWGNIKTETDEFARYLSPDKLSQPKENTPHPLFQIQRLTAEWLPSKLHNHNLHKPKHKSDKIPRKYKGKNKENDNKKRNNSL